MSEEQLYITALDIRDVGGIQRFRARVGKTAIVVGANGQGKTSLLSAVQSVLEGGHDADLLRLGCERGEVCLTLSNGSQILKVITPKESTLDVRTKDGGIVKAPATYVKSIVPSISFDPIGFLNADPKERAAFLLKTLPLTFTDAEVNGVLEVPAVTGPVPLQRLNELRDGRYQERADVNRQIRDLEGTVADMEKSLPPGNDTNWSDERDRLEKSVAEVGNKISTITAEIALEAEQTKSKKQAEIQKSINALQEALSNYTALVDKTAAETLAEQTRELEAERASLTGYLGEAKVKSEEQQRSAGVREVIEKRRGSIKGFSEKSDRLSAVIKSLDDLKVRKLKELPIQGLDLTVEKGKPIIRIDGIALDQLNRQQQLFIAIRAVSLAAGRLPLILCEVAELDDEHLKELTSATEEAGIQLIVARWANGQELKVVDSEQYAELAS